MYVIDKKRSKQWFWKISWSELHQIDKATWRAFKAGINQPFREVLFRDFHSYNKNRSKICT
jgi:hypothetical protein